MRRPFSRFSAISRLFVCSAAVVAAGSCEWSPLLAPTGTTITLVSGAESIAANGSTDITAFLVQGIESSTPNPNANATPGGIPVRDGTVVTFSTTLGRVQPAEATTTDGRVTVRLIGDGRTGTASISAVSGPAFETLGVTVGSTGGGSQNTMSITPPNTITASVPANFSVGVGAGTIARDAVVNFGDGTPTVTLGSISSTQPVQHLFPAGGNFTVSVSATSADGTPLFVSTTVAVAPLGVVLTANPSTVNAGASVLFTVTTSAGALIDHVEFDFGDGAGFQSFPSTTTNHVFSTGGTRTVRALVVPVVGDPRLVQVQVVVN
jgi:hypothetical protein